MLTLTCCQDHILTENIWFECSETSYSGEERRFYRCGTNDEQPITEDRATQPMEAGGWVSQFTSGMQQEILQKLTFDCRGANPNIIYQLRFYPLCVLKWFFFQTIWPGGCVVTLVAFVWFSPLCMFRWYFKLCAWTLEKLQWLHLCDFFPLCVFKCFLKLLAWMDA